jgi:3,4-dihydroxy 2-butanone 4-phosphate synthase / GTP cyclohydrolase II
MDFLSVTEALHHLRDGKMIIVTDDENRENEGDLCCAAEFITPEIVNFMATKARGLICVPMDPDSARRLDLPPMVQNNTSWLQTAFTVSVDAAHDISTGISASDRSKTIELLSNPNTEPEALARPGHINPLCAVSGGVLQRAGQTEAMVDLCKLAGLNPVGVICEIMDEDGTMARMPQLQELSREWDIGIITVSDIIEHRHQTEQLVQPMPTENLKTQHGNFVLHPYITTHDGQRHFAIVKGEINTDDVIMVRVHSESLIHDTFGAFPPDGGTPLASAMQMIDYKGQGIVLYMRRSYSGEKLGDADKQQASSPETLRNYGIGAQILYHLGVRKMRLITNHPKKLVGLHSHGLEVVDTTSISRLSALPTGDFPTSLGHFTLHGFVSAEDNKEHLAMVKGDISGDDPVLVRIHSECLTGDILSSQRCDCGSQLADAMRQVEEEGRGVVIYVRQEGRGIGLANKLKAYALQDEGMDTVEANQALGYGDDLRSYTIPADILRHLGVSSVRLMTNNPEKVDGLVKEGFTVERLPHIMEINDTNRYYMETKKEKMNHLL